MALHDHPIPAGPPEPERPSAQRGIQTAVIRDELCQLLRDHAVQPTQFRHGLITNRAFALADFIEARGRAQGSAVMLVGMLLILALAAAAGTGFALARLTL